MRAFDRDMANGYIAGALGEAAEAEGEAAMIAFGREALASAVRQRHPEGDPGRGVHACGSTSHGSGAHTVRPSRARRICRKDIGDVRSKTDSILRAKSASLDFFSTCHGAHLTGIAAVEAAAKTLGR